MRHLLIVLMLCVVLPVSAQIRIIPKTKLLEIANPQMAESPLRFNTDRVDFGTIDEMSGVWSGSVKLRNNGSDTIAVTQIKSTCGCFNADMPKRVLAPNEEITVSLKYYPRGHSGAILQRLFLYTGISNNKPSAILQLQGRVVASSDRSDDYPYVRGVLRLRQDTVRFIGKEREVQRIACMNGGSTTIHPSVDAVFTDSRLSVHFEPEQLSPKQEGDMVVTFDPAKVKDGISSLKIQLKGVGTTPRYSVIGVVTKNRE